MATEVLRPHDCLARVRHHHAHAHAHARRPSPRQAAARPARAAQRGRQAAPARREVRVVKVAAAAEDAYAGTAFGSMSPSPRALPLPRFSSRAGAAGAAAAVDDSATRELRRMLGLH